MLDMKLDRHGKVPLYAQIRDSILTAVDSGALQPGARLPTVAGFAKELGVTQATILRAFEDLSKAGIVVSHVGRGTFITGCNDRAGDASAHLSTLAPGAQDPEFALAARRLRMGIAKSLEALQILTQRPGLIELISGVPDPDLIRPNILDKLAREALKSDQAVYQNYSPSGGLPELRRAVAEWLSGVDVKISPGACVQIFFLLLCAVT